MSLGGLRVYGHSLERTDQVRAPLNECSPTTVRNRSHQCVQWSDRESDTASHR